MSRREYALCGGIALCILLVGAAWTRHQLLQSTGIVPTRVAVIDLTGIVRAQQERTATQLAQRATGAEDAQARMQRAVAYGRTLDTAARKLGAECRCVLLIREAVVAGDVPDLTGRLLELARTE